MQLNFSDIQFDSTGRCEVPELMVQTIDGRNIGILSGVTALKIHPKFTELSSMTFDIAAMLDGEANPSYALVTGHRLIYTSCYGVYEIMNPTEEGDGISLVKHVEAYSVEKLLEGKRFFLEEGTYRFWNPVSPSETLLGRVLEKAPGWRIGEVSASLWDTWRTFDQYDDYLLSFLYGDMCEKYRCAVSFDPYIDASTGKRTINIYDADAEVTAIPIYLDYDNLIKTLNADEKSDELITALRPYGADELDIRDVNPTGAWLYDLTNFIESGDIPAALATKWEAWEASVEAARENYIALINLRALRTSELLAKQVERQELVGQRETYEIERNTVVQATNSGLSPSGMRTLAQIKADIATTDAAIGEIDDDIEDIEDDLDPSVPGSTAAQIKAIVDSLALTNTSNFTVEEQATLQHYMIEQDLQEDSFVASDVGTAVSGTAFSLSGATLAFSGDAESLDTGVTGQALYTLENGTLTIGTLTADVIRATVETKSGAITASFYLGGSADSSTSASTGIGLLTLYGTCGTATQSSSSLSIANVTATAVISEDFSAYQRYSVQLDLLAFAKSVLAEKATKTYEFSVDAGNFVWEQSFAPFRNALALGKGIYLNVNGRKVIAPIIELEMDFEDQASFSVLCSSRFKRNDNVATLKGMIEKSYSSSRSFDAGKYLQSLVNTQANEVADFMSASLDAAKNRIVGAANQTVRIDGAGIHLGEYGTNRQLSIVNDMIALTDDNWSTAKLAIGYFKTPSNGTYFGVNADVIAGKLLVGTNLTIDTGDGTFTVDSTGVYINSLKFYIRPGASGTASALNSVLSGIETEISGKITTFYQSTVPSDPNSGDLWFVTADVSGTSYKQNELYRYSGSAWSQINDAEAIAAASAAQSAANAASAAQATADSKIETFRQATNPAVSWASSSTKAKHVGDIWYNTSSSYVGECAPKKAYRYANTGTSSSPFYAWQSLEDGDIPTLNTFKTNTETTLSNVINANGYLKADQLRGAIDAQYSTMSAASTTGNVLFDSKGMYLLNNTTKATATKAVWMNENGILFGTGSAGHIEDTSGADEWDWTTAIGHDGIVAEAIAAGTISGVTISAGTLSGGTISGAAISGGAITGSEISIGGTTQTPNFYVDSSGNLTLNGTVTFTASNNPAAGKVDESALISTINQSSDKISSSVVSVDNNNTTLATYITQTATEISSKVSSGSVISSINQSAESITINANKLNLSGYVTASSLTSTGTTTIDGSRITTGTISASRLDLTGYVTVSSLGSSGTTSIDGARITTGTISADRIDVGSLKVKEIYNAAGTKTAILCGSNNTSLTIGGDSSYDFTTTYMLGQSIVFGRYNTYSSVNLTIDCSNHALKPTGSGTSLWTIGTTSAFFSKGYFDQVLPGSVSTSTLGSSASPWLKLYTKGIDYNGYFQADDSGILAPQYSKDTVCSLGTSAYYWGKAYIGSSEAHIGKSSTSKIGFFGTSVTDRKTLSTTTQNMSYSSATSSNYLTILNNIVGILKLYGLISA